MHLHTKYAFLREYERETPILYKRETEDTRLNNRAPSLPPKCVLDGKEDVTTEKQISVLQHKKEFDLYIHF